MKCVYNCNKNNFIFLCLTTHENIDGNKNIKKYKFCSTSCMNRFKENNQYVIKN